jgi:hypothetical protein
MFLKEYGDWALVTGGNSGIGFDFVNEIAKSKMNIIIVGRNSEKNKTVVDLIKNKYSVDVIALNLDLSDPNNNKILLEETKNFAIGLIVLASGYGLSGEFLNHTLDSELNQLDLNNRSVLELVHSFATRFKNRKKSGIVLFGSLLGYQGVALASNYSATKAYIQSLAEGLFYEFKKYHIDIISCAPGPVKSNFAERAKMKMGFSQSVEGIAKITFSKLGKSTTVTPGFLSKFLTYSLHTSPRGIRTWILNKIMKGMAVND